MKKLLLLTFLASVILSCNSKSNEEELDQIKETEEFDETSKVLSERFASIYETVPTSELTAYLQSVDAQYDGAFINDPGRAAQYLASHDDAALAMGIYYMDFVYAAAYHKSDQVGELYSAMAMLSDSIGTGRAFNQTILEQFSSELEENPEAKQYVSDALVEASKHLNTSDRTRLSTLVMTGILVERLHLISSMIYQAQDTEDLPKEDLDLLITPLMKLVAQEQANVDKIVEAVNLVRTPEDDDLGPVLLQELKHEYERLDEAKKELDATEVVDPSVLAPIFEVVADLRNGIISRGE